MVVMSGRVTTATSNLLTGKTALRTRPTVQQQPIIVTSNNITLQMVCQDIIRVLAWECLQALWVCLVIMVGGP